MPAFDLSTSPRASAPTPAAERKELSRTRLYIGNLHYDTRWSELKDFVASVSKPTSTYLAPHTDEKEKCKGYGFAEFESPEAASNVVKMLDGVEGPHGRPVVIRYAWAR